MTTTRIFEIRQDSLRRTIAFEVVGGKRRRVAVALARAVLAEQEAAAEAARKQAEADKAAAREAAARKEKDMKIEFRAASSGRMSNTKYHRHGKPWWWVRFEVGGESVFADLHGRYRGDHRLACIGTIMLPGPGDYVVHTGCGDRDTGHRETDTLRVYADGSSVYNPDAADRRLDETPEQHAARVAPAAPAVEVEQFDPCL